MHSYLQGTYVSICHSISSFILCSLFSNPDKQFCHGVKNENILKGDIRITYTLVTL